MNMLSWCKVIDDSSCIYIRRFFSYKGHSLSSPCSHCLLVSSNGYLLAIPCALMSYFTITVACITYVLYLYSMRICCNRNTAMRSVIVLYLLANYAQPHQWYWWYAFAVDLLLNAAHSRSLIIDVSFVAFVSVRSEHIARYIKLYLCIYIVSQLRL